MQNYDIHAIWLTATLTPDSPKVFKLIDTFGSAEQVYKAERVELASIGLLQRDEIDLLLNKSLDGAWRIVADCRRLGIEITHIGKEDYPPLLEHIAQPPVVLYYKGDMSTLIDPLSICIVGTRGATSYGEGVAMRLAYDLAMCGITIVSGLAEGIDSTAHIGALKAGGKTVAVMPVPLDRVYPKVNEELYANIINSGGLAISEYYPSFTVDKSAFVIRNRIMSGISYGTVIVEAPERSGALATARHAIDQNRELFAVPGNITSPNSHGTNGLIKSMSAMAVTSATDILTEYVTLYPEKLFTQRSAYIEIPKEETKLKLASPPPKFGGYREWELTKSEEKIISLIEITGSATQKLLIRTCGMEQKELEQTLQSLSGKGAVIKDPTGRYHTVGKPKG